MKFGKILGLALAATLTLIASAFSQTARLQVIHNAADPAAAMVDIYVNGGMYEDDFAFREATEFRTVPAGVQLNIQVAPGTSTSAAEAIATIPVTLLANKTYVAIANGVIGSGFAANPDGQVISFNLFARDNIREKANWNQFVDVIAFHGSTDAPTVDVRNRNGGIVPLFNDLTYGEFSSYRSLADKKYTLDITPGSGSPIVASFEVDLNGLAGGAAVVFASGFFNPANNNGGPAFGLFAALPNGAVAAFPAVTPTARLQVIHNAADPAAAVVDIYVNGALYEDDFAFREATEFRTVPAGVQLNIGVAPGNSGSAAEAIATIPVTLEANKTYVAIANGVLGSGFSANPDGRSISFALFAKDGIRERARWFGRVDVIGFHGATDAPNVDILARGWPFGPVVSNASYGDFGGYASLAARKYILDVTPGNNNNVIVASFEADLSGLNNGAAVVFASGFLNPAANGNGPAFGLFAALANGTVVTLPAVQQTARLQVIHNAPDPAAAVVDIYVNDALYQDDFAFRAATEFRTVPAGVQLNIQVAPGTSSSSSEAIATIPVTLEAGKTYVAIANGVIGSGFAANPDGKNISFNLFARDGVRESALSGFGVSTLVFHGSPDAPTVDVYARLGFFNYRSISDLTYGEFSDYRFFFAKNYVLTITPGNSTAPVAAFQADLRTLGGGAAVVFASGFLTPANNNNGPAFGLYAALPNGTVIALPAASTAQFVAADEDGKTIDEQAIDQLGKNTVLPESFDLAQNFPNPFNPTTTISFALPKASNVNLTVYNILGQEVASLINGPMGAGNHEVNFDASAMASGIYFYRLVTDDFTAQKKMVLMK